MQVQLASAVQPLHDAPELAPQELHVDAPAAVEKVPAVQTVQFALPVVFLDVPGRHAAHGPPLGPVYPTLHVQLVDAVQALHDAPAFAGHATHEGATAGLVEVEKEPAGQPVHALPVVFL